MENTFKAIISGFKNYAFLNKEIEEIAINRAKICSICPSAVETMLKQILPDSSIKEIAGLKCADCGCILSAKVRQLYDNCPQNKW